MSRRGENIYKRKDGRWEGRYIKEYIDGKIHYGYVFAKTYKETKAKLHIAIEKNELEEGNFPHLEQSESNDIFTVVASDWLASKQPQLKESSLVKYMYILKVYILPEYGERQICDIKRTEISHFCNKLLFSGGAKGNGLSPKSVSDIISVIKNIFTYAEQEKDCFVADLSRMSVKQKTRQMRILSYTEQQNLSNYLCSDLTLCNLGILICLYTGLRVGEICALKWKDIFFDEKYLYVHQTMQRIQEKEEQAQKKTKIIISSPKSECSIRKIPIPDSVFDLLNKYKCPPDTFFLTGLQYCYIEPRTMQNRFKTVSKKCGIDDINFHALRHTFATRCVELGFDIKSLSEILGHANVNITLNRYVHPTMELKQKNMNRLSELLAVS